MKKLILFTLLILLPVCAVAQTVTFAWDPHPEATQITGFKLYQSKISNSYTGLAVATYTPGTLTTGTISQPGLGRYFFILRAFKDDAGFIVESDNSNEVTLVVKPKPPHLVSAIQTVMKAVKDTVKWALGINGKKGLRIVHS